MWAMIALAMVVTVVFAGPRHPRQADGSFWWLQTLESQNASSTPAVSAAASEEEKRLANVSPLNSASPPSAVLSFGPVTNAGCICVPYYQCSASNIITDGAGLIDIRFAPKVNDSMSATNSHSACPNFFDVCCKDPTKALVVQEPPRYSPRCGKRNEEGLNVRITGFKDNQAQFGEFPWMTAVLRTERIGDKEVNLYVCGGSLIHPSVVLTSAHCIYAKMPTSLKVRLGEWDTQRTYEFFPHQDLNVKSTVLHPEYNGGSLWNDYGLLFLDGSVELSPHVDTICLPSPGQNFDRALCYVTGWGKDDFGKESQYQNVLKKIDLPIVPNTECENSLRTTRLGSFFQLDDSFICAGGVKGKDACKGDGGSPLVCLNPKDPGYFVQAGIVAWGIGCGENGIPGVYADVTDAVPWINKQVSQELGLSTGYWGPV